MIPIFGDDVIMAGRGGKPRFAGGDGRLADHMFTFVKVSLLFADMYDDLGWPGGALVIPKAGRLGLPRKTSGQWLLGVRWDFFATANDERDGARACDLEQMAKFHGAAADTIVWLWRIQSQIYRFWRGGSAVPLVRRSLAKERLTLRAVGNTLRVMTTVQSPINLKNWIEENREKFKPPVSNRYLYDGRDFFVMVIKGPNARNDFHLVDSEEYFYQLKGDIKVRVREGERIVDHVVHEGETFFIPPNVPHSPQRPPDTVGVVVERRRPPGEKEHVIFYCENCGALVEDIHFDCADIVEHFSQAMLDFWNDDARRTCKKCGKKVEKPEPVKSL
ncbi:MAG: 3-hydroxyanthranilate 3,4-dioxygenase [Verrucomicrobia bacterium]|nr:MAG: 3-hydroxyanthranilate 3,4-dioxygenase [Verrucomicrobiota bacterium]